MSQPNLESVSVPSVLVKKPQMNVYTVMLIVALLSLMLACLFLYLEIREYGGWGAVKGRIAAVAQPMLDYGRAIWI
jgi:hypothetical protein